MNRIVSFLFLLPLLASCAHEYKIEGVSSVSGLDGKMLYLKSLKGQDLVTVDSAAMVHGLFSMKGHVDSVQMVTLYMDNECIMPLVLESGTVQITISDVELKAIGTSLNDALYEFITKKNEIEEDLADLEHKEARMVLDGVDWEKVNEQLRAESDSLVRTLNVCVKNFIADNYDNILGPNVFMMLCGTLPYPLMTPQIDEIIKNAPASFKKNQMVEEFMTKAKENMQLLEERKRLEQNASYK